MAKKEVTQLSPGDRFSWPAFMNAPNVDVCLGGYTFDANGGQLVTVIYFASGRELRYPVSGSGATVLLVDFIDTEPVIWFTID